MIGAGIPNPLLFMGGSSSDPLDELGVIERSLRLRSTAGAYLSRMPGAAGNKKTWTLRTWLRRGQLGALQGLFASEVNSDYRFDIGLLANDGIMIYQLVAASTIQISLTSGPLFKDPTAHYELVIACDTTTFGIKAYVNGTEIALTGTQPAANLDTYVNAVSVAHYLGSAPTLSAQKFDGYLSHTVLVDGQALTPASFSQAHPQTGQWRPRSKAEVKSLVDAGGVNSCFLCYDDTTSLSSLTADASIKGNHFTAANVSLTAGATYDAMRDTPTNVFCVYNPLIATEPAKTNGNLASTGISRGTLDANAIACQWEFTANTGAVIGGVISSAGIASTVAIPNGSTYGFRLAGGTLEYTTNGAAWTTLANGLTDTQLPYVANGGATFNAGQHPMAYAMSAGYRTLSTKNLPQNSAVTVAGSFTGTLAADGPYVLMNGSPQTLTINGNPVTFGTHADPHANGFKIRSASASYNSNAVTNTWVATVLAPAQKSLYRHQNGR